MRALQSANICVTQRTQQMRQNPRQEADSQTVVNLKSNP